MTCYEISSQAEYDARKDEKDACLHIKAGEISAYGSASVRAYGSASVRAYDSASVSAYGSASVSAYGSASVSASGSASVSAYGSASVSASGSASVRAYGSASVSASGSASVSAGKYVPVQQQPGYKGKTTGGVIIKIPDLSKATPSQWAGSYAIDTTDGHITVYKAVDADLNSGRALAYPIGETVTAPDWADTRACGHGLHFGPTPHHAARYHHGATVRYLACQVQAGTIIPLGDKIKAPSCLVLHEVDADGRQLAGDKATSPGAA